MLAASGGARTGVGPAAHPQLPAKLLHRRQGDPEHLAGLDLRDAEERLDDGEVYGERSAASLGDVGVASLAAGEELNSGRAFFGHECVKESQQI